MTKDLESENEALRKRCRNQKYELRRLNKLLAYIRMGVKAADLSDRNDKQSKQSLEKERSEYWEKINWIMTRNKEEPKQ